MKKEGREYNSPKFIAGFFSFLIIILLILSGPAQAYSINFDVVDNKVNRGEMLNFLVDLNLNEKDNITSLFVELKNSFDETIACSFDLQSNIISGCENIQLNKISEETIEKDYGYGYGYGFDKKITFSLVLNTTNYKEGEYKTYLTTYTDQEENKKRGETIIISKSTKLNFYSVRANKGKLAYINNDNNFSYSNFDFSSWTSIRYSERKNQFEIQGRGTLVLDAKTNVGKNYKLNINFDNSQIIENTEGWLNVSGKSKNAFFGEENNRKQNLVCGNIGYNINKKTGFGEIIVNCNSFDFKIKNVNFKFI